MYYLFFGIVLYSVLARILRWTSILQQKEYRSDRMLSYFQTKEGQTQLTKLFDFPLTRNQLVRPKITSKSFLIIVTALFLFITNSLDDSGFTLAGKYILIPVYVFVSALPYIFLSKLITLYYQHKATVLVDKKKPLIIGITGSYGKTTTKQLITHILKSKYTVWQSPKSFNTPLSLPKSFAETYKNEKILIIEFAAYKKGEIKKLTQIFPPQIGVLTGLNHQHLSLFGTFENLIQAKKELFDSLPKNSLVLVPHTKPPLNQILDKLNQLKITKTTALIKKRKLTHHGFLTGKIGNLKFKSKLIGSHYTDNLSLAVSIAKHFKLTDKQIVKQIESFTPGEMFVTKFQTQSGFTVIDDSRTSNTTGFEQATVLAKQLKSEHKILIFSGFVDLGTQQSHAHQNAAKLLQHFSIIIDTSKAGIPEFCALGDKYKQLLNIQEIKQHISSFNPQKTLILIEGKMLPNLIPQLKDL